MKKTNKENSISTVKVIVLSLLGAIAGVFLGVQAYIHGWLG